MNNSKTLIEKALSSKAFAGLDIDEIGDDHLYTGLETPLRADAFEQSDAEKKEQIAALFEQIMHVMGLDLTDDSLRGTGVPRNGARSYRRFIKGHSCACG